MLRSIIQMDPGQSVQIALWRDHAQQTAAVTVGAWPDLRSPKAATMAQAGMVDLASSPDLGMGLATITPQARQRYKLSPSLNGVLIALVSKNTEASERDVQPGDVILNVDGTAVGTPDEVEQILEKASTEQRRYLGFLIAAKDGLRWVSFYTGREPG